MAEEKKSVILYVDIISTFESMTDKEAGRLIKHFLRYVNDLNPKAPDKITQIAFEPIKQQLKRDLVKWEIIKHDRSSSGILGNLKRWNKDLYDRVIKEEITIKEAEEIAKCRKVSQPDTTVSQPVANIAVNDNVSVNVNGIVSDNVIKNTEREEKISLKTKEKKDSSPGAEIQYPFGEQFLTLWEQWKEYKRGQFSFQYKTLQSEQAAINDLVRISGGIEIQATEIIHQSMAKGWKGFFQLKNSQNGKDKQPTGGAINTSSMVSRIMGMPDKVGNP